MLLHWVFVAACGLSLAVVSRSCSWWQCQGLLIAVASLVAEHRHLLIQNSQSNPLLLLFPSPVQFSSVTQLCPTLCNPMDCSITNSWNMLKLMCIKSVMPSNHLILCRPLLLLSIFPSIRVFSNESVLHIRWPKY